jgi:hypothetical protein
VVGRSAAGLRQGYSAVGAFVKACAALDALVIVAYSYVLDGDATHRARFHAGTASGAIVLVDDDSHDDSILTESGNAFAY